jgi:hypothetical protein
MRINKAELEAIIKEELASVLKEASLAEEDSEPAATAADLVRPLGVPSIEVAAKALAAMKKIKNLKRTERRKAKESCMQWTDRQARKRGWDVDGTKGGLFRDAGMTIHQQIAYEKILKKCQERRAQNKQMYKRPGDLAVQKAAGAVSAGRAAQYLKSLNLGFVKEAVKKELAQLLNEVVSPITAVKVLDKGINAKGSIEGAIKDDIVGLGLGTAGLLTSSPYAMAVLFTFASIRSATKEWNALPYNHPFKIKHREYLKRAKALKKDERRLARIEKYGYDPKEEVFKKNAFADAKGMVQKLYGSGKKKTQLAPEDEDAILQYVMKGKK